MSPSVVHGQPQSSGRGFRGSSSQKVKRYGERGGNTRYRVTQISLLIQCRISCGQSDLTQPEIHMAELYLGG